MLLLLLLLLLQPPLLSSLPRNNNEDDVLRAPLQVLFLHFLILISHEPCGEGPVVIPLLLIRKRRLRPCKVERSHLPLTAFTFQNSSHGTAHSFPKGSEGQGGRSRRGGPTFAAVGGGPAVLVGQAGPGGVHVHATQAGQGRVVELLLHTSQLVAPSPLRELGGRGCVHVGAAVLPGNDVDDTGHGWGAESVKRLTRLGSGQPHTLLRGDTTLATADLTTGLIFTEHLLCARP